ncbi:serine hydrolase domain-containing protein [Colwellia sp. 1_MG-2023]|uniref:serine hydrolase domain-containing protein n=1 Tax=Colwellia sp. 1_MG-2023 TaxID=3062649 RepID=UPI0026E11FFB|nr:serine hydrolase domain-containing protein [Colwellia sp. 1_MG-2023]MDO6447269.1 serine hydrolase domain-containing protein [Colwellia sp. 1_MG-2023]
MKLVTGMILLALLPTPSIAKDLEKKVDELFSVIDDNNAPGCNVGVIHNGKFVYKKGHGLANLELGASLDGNNIHRIASVSKQFTAMSVLLLADEGKINLDDDIRKHLPELKDYGSKITINSMLGHTSGMADYDYISSYSEDEVEGGLNLRNSMGNPFRLGNEDYLSIDDFYDVVKKVSLRHEPNKKWQYSNLAYFLLSMLVEEVSGESLRDYANKRIFQPLEMNDTFYSDDPTEIVKNRASGYKKNDKGGYQTDMTNLFWVGDGGLHTNLDDLLKWDQHFYNPSLGKNPQQLMVLLNTPNSNFSVSGGLYANGQVVTKVDGYDAYMHGGAWLGVQTFYLRIPKKNLSTIVLCNDANQDSASYAKAITEFYLHN